MEDFYRHDRMADGHLNKCKECVKSRVKKHRAGNIECIKEYDRNRSDLPNRVALRAAYAKTDRGKERQASGARAYVARNPQKRAAHIMVGNAVRDGKLIRLPCEKCGDLKTDAHHDDHSKPLVVIWLCRACHMAHHKASRRQQAAL